MRALNRGLGTAGWLARWLIILDECSSFAPRVSLCQSLPSGSLFIGLPPPPSLSDFSMGQRAAVSRKPLSARADKLPDLRSLFQFLCRRGTAERRKKQKEREDRCNLYMYIIPKVGRQYSLKPSFLRIQRSFATSEEVTSHSSKLG